MKIFTFLPATLLPLFSFCQNVGIGTTNPQAQLSVGSNSQFRVNNTGDITRINDVPYSYPNTQGASGKTLVNDGAGNMSWKEAGMPIGSIVQCYGGDTANLIAKGFSIIGYSQGFQQYRGAATGTWTPFSNTINTTGGFYMQDNPSVYSGTEMLVYYNNIVYRWNPSGTVWTQSIANTVPGFTAPSTASAVWTGSEMIIYNGIKGVKYNPTTNTWTAIADAPVNKINHTAVWTGTEMIVWGGFSAGTVTQSGHKYNPTTNTWSAAISTVGAPSARQRHAAVYTGTRMFITQGEDNASNTPAGTYSYDPATNTWGSALASTFGFTNAKAVWTGSIMLVTGNVYSVNLGISNDVTYAYNAAGNTWSTFANEGKIGNNDYRSNIVWAGTEMLMIRGSGAQKFTYTGTGMAWSLPSVTGYYIMRKAVNN